MEWFTVIGFIVFGIILIIVEIVFVPGTTIVGIGGFVCSAYGIYYTFVNMGNATGSVVLVLTSVVSIAATIYSLKTRAWEKFSLKNEMNVKVNEELRDRVQVGDFGKSISSLKPVGKAIFEEKEMEVRTTGEYLRENQKIKVIKIDHTKIFVEPITNA